MGGTLDGQSFPNRRTRVTGFLLDENPPARLTFTPSLPVTHAQELGGNPTDSQLWAHARAHQLVIVTKDADFSDRILVSNPPPWIVHLRFGNMRRSEFHRFLASVWMQVETFLPANKLVCVYADRIEAFT
jgi:predicted nuclease of predicted toxin-antitoxin system